MKAKSSLIEKRKKKGKEENQADRKKEGAKPNPNAVFSREGAKGPKKEYGKKKKKGEGYS